jgi:hypothetical protein
MLLAEHSLDVSSPELADLSLFALSLRAFLPVAQSKRIGERIVFHRREFNSFAV